MVSEHQFVLINIFKEVLRVLSVPSTVAVDYLVIHYA